MCIWQRVEIFWALFVTPSLSYFTTARLSFTCILHPQCIHMIFIIWMIKSVELKQFQNDGKTRALLSKQNHTDSPAQVVVNPMQNSRKETLYWRSEKHLEEITSFVSLVPIGWTNEQCHNVHSIFVYKFVRQQCRWFDFLASLKGLILEHRSTTYRFIARMNGPTLLS